MASEQDMQPKTEKAHNPNDDKSWDVVSESFGEAYATRCEEEGMGGTYGGKPWITETQNHPECKKTQGSEAMAKEKGSSG